MAKKATSKELVSQEDPTAQVPSLDFNFGDDAGKGMETGKDFVSIPFLNILQALSPQVKAEDSTLKAGMIYNTVTEEAIPGKEGLVIIPVKMDHRFVEYKPRNQGGGFVADYDPNSAVVAKAKAESKKFGKYKTPAGNELAETFYLYAIEAESGAFLVIPFSSTKITPFKAWNTKINLFNHRAWKIADKPPLFAHTVRLTTALEVRSGGDSYNFRFASAKQDAEINGVKYPGILLSMIGPKDPRYQEAKGFLEMLESGVAKASHETQVREHYEEMPSASAAPTGENAPF